MTRLSSPSGPRARRRFWRARSRAGSRRCWSRDWVRWRRWRAVCAELVEQRIPRPARRAFWRWVFSGPPRRTAAERGLDAAETEIRAGGDRGHRPAQGARQPGHGARQPRPADAPRGRAPSGSRPDPARTRHGRGSWNWPVATPPAWIAPATTGKRRWPTPPPQPSAWSSSRATIRAPRSRCSRSDGARHAGGRAGGPAEGPRAGRRPRRPPALTGSRHPVALLYLHGAVVDGGQHARGVAGPPSRRSRSAGRARRRPPPSAPASSPGSSTRTPWQPMASATTA